MLNVLQNTSRRRFIAWMSFILEPIDRCLQSVQALSASSHALLHMLRGSSPLAEARQAYDAMLTAPLRDGLLSALFWYFDGVREGDDWDLEGFVRGRILSICGQLWWRFLAYDGWPFRLAGLADPVSSQAEKAVVCQSFDAAHDCCLDAAFSRKVRNQDFTELAAGEEVLV
jgi:hypothetical protein